jgi:hypothetical protein
MSRNRSRKAARYGRLAEEVAARHYDLDLDRCVCSYSLIESLLLLASITERPQVWPCSIR